jgi:opacity protein-like surface antigen
MNMVTRFSAALLLFALAVPPVMAEGYYAGLDVGQAKAKDACTGLPAGVSGCKDTATVFRVAGGYQFTPMWGAEVSYGATNKPSLGTGAGVTSSSWQANSLQVSATGTFPVADAFSVIGKVGIASTDLKTEASGAGGSASLSATSTKLAFGIGAQYDFTKNIGVRAQYEDLGTVGDASTGTSKVTLFTAGVIYRF